MECNDFKSGNIMIPLVFGQSNSANYGNRTKMGGDGVYQFNRGRCFPAEDPLIGCTGTGGSVWTRLGQKIIDAALYDKILFVPIGVGGSEIARWAPNGDLHKRISRAHDDLQDADLRFTHLLWHQGESDHRMKTSKENYKLLFNEMLESIRSLGITAPIYICTASYLYGNTCDTIVQAQQELMDPTKKIYPGPDTDQLGDYYRYDGVHFSEKGLNRFADLWLEKLMIQY